MKKEKILSSQPKPLEIADPMELKGIQISGADFDLMVENIIEEYIMLGYDEKTIIYLFKHPFYKFTNNVYKLKGQEYIKQSIEKVKAKWIGGIK